MKCDFWSWLYFHILAFKGIMHCIFVFKDHCSSVPVMKICHCLNFCLCHQIWYPCWNYNIFFQQIFLLTFIVLYVVSYCLINVFRQQRDMNSVGKALIFSWLFFWATERLEFEILKIYSLTMTMLIIPKKKLSKNIFNFQINAHLVWPAL